MWTGLSIRARACGYGCLGRSRRIREGRVSEHSRQGERVVLAMLALAEGLPVFRTHHAYRHYAVCLLRLGNAYEEIGNSKDAFDSLEESLPIFERLQLPKYEKLAQDALERLRNPRARPAIVT
jgi:hypothetical protein